jgi:hypothetical protein
MPLIVEVWFLHLTTCLIKTSFLAKNENLRPCSSLRDKHTDAHTYKHTRSITYTRYAITRALTIKKAKKIVNVTSVAKFSSFHIGHNMWLKLSEII